MFKIKKKYLKSVLAASAVTAMLFPGLAAADTVGIYPRLPEAAGIPRAILPQGTTEGSGFVSASFSAAGGGEISFSYNFITDEAYWDEGGVFKTDVNDFWVVGLFDATPGDSFGAILDARVGGDVYTSTFSPIGAGASGPFGDYFRAETGRLNYILTVPSDFNGSVQLGFGVFDLEDDDVPSALLVDNVAYDGNPLFGGDFSAEYDAFSPWFYPYFNPAGNQPMGSEEQTLGSLGGPAGVFGVLSSELFPGPGAPGDGNYAYISTLEGSLPAPVPVPATIWLLGSGIFGLIGLRKKQQN